MLTIQANKHGTYGKVKNTLINILMLNLHKSNL